MYCFKSELGMAEDLYYTGSVSQDIISLAETKLSIKFSLEYCEYLLVYGAASACGHEFTGICPSKRLNVVDVTLMERRKHVGVPDDWYVIEQVNIDGVVIWQSTNGNIYQTRPGSNPCKIASSLAEYLCS